MKKHFLSLTIAGIVTLALSINAVACEFCALHLGGNFLESNNNFVSLTYRQTVANTNATNNVFTPSTTKITIDTIQFLANYNFTDTFGLNLVVPQFSKNRTDSVTPANNAASSGIGDITTLAHYFLMKDPEMGKLALQGGVKWATGARATSAAVFTPGVMDTDVTVGTGSTDYLIGAAYSKTLGELILTGNLLYIIKTTGYDGYAYGNTLNYNLSGAYRLDPSFYLFLSAYGESTAMDNDTRALVTGTAGLQPNTGGNVIYLSPGFQWLVGQWIFETNYQVPVIRSFNNAPGASQLVVDNKWLVSVKYLF